MCSGVIFDLILSRDVSQTAHFKNYQLPVHLCCQCSDLTQNAQQSTPSFHTLHLGCLADCRVLPISASRLIYHHTLDRFFYERQAVTS